MANRYSLHINKLELFKTWLSENDIKFRPGKGDFQVLQVETAKNGYQCIHSRFDMREHYTVADNLMPLVKRFIRESRAKASVQDNESQSNQELMIESSTNQ